MSLQKFVRRDPEILKVKVLEARVRFSLPPPEVDVRHLDSALEREILSSSTATDLSLRNRAPSWNVVESSPPPPRKRSSTAERDKVSHSAPFEIVTKEISNFVSS